jgi:hypothetical protein
MHCALSGSERLDHITSVAIISLVDVSIIYDHKHSLVKLYELEWLCTAHAVSLQLLTGEAWVQFHGSTCGICGEQIGTDPGFSPSTSVFSYHLSFHQCSILIHHPVKCIRPILGCSNMRLSLTSLLKYKKVIIHEP